MTTDTETTETTGTVQAYVDLDGVHSYYEATGDGPPLVLLHGGMCTVETWGGVVPQLTDSFRVFTPERRGHGRTAAPGEITYDTMAADTIAFLETIVGEPADLVGWSDGAVVALLVALWRPDLVRRLVYVGNCINQDGLPAEVRAMAEHLSPDVLPPMLRQLHEAVAPGGAGSFDTLFAEIRALWTSEPNVAIDQLATLAVPTLLVAADHDMITIEQLADALRAIPEAQLAIVPGADHGFPMEHPDLLVALVRRFLA